MPFSKGNAKYANYNGLKEWQDTFQSQGFGHITSDYMPSSASPSAGVRANANTGENFTCVLMARNKIRRCESTYMVSDV